MSTGINLLVIEDKPADFRLIVRHLAQHGLAARCHCVATLEELEAAIAQGGWDAALSDYSLQVLDFRHALGAIQAKCPDLPVILVSGSVGEELAVELLKQGVWDFVLKDRLARLVPAIKRSMQDAADRRARVRTEKALRDGEDRYRALVETAHDWVWEVDASWRYTYASPRVEGLLGFRPEEVLGRTLFALMPEAEARRVEPLCVDLASRREPILVWVKTRHRDGRLLVLDVSATPVLDEDGTLLGYRGIDRDITERRRVEEQLQQLARAVEQSPVSIMITDANGNIEFVNPKFAEVTGYTFEEVRGKNPRILRSGETPAEEYRRLWATLTAGLEWRGEFHNRRKDGTLYWEAASLSALRDDNGVITHFVAVKEDVTEKKLTEAKFLRAQRVESIGSLASGIAHDLNNLLAPIIMGAPTLEWDDSPESRRQTAEIIESSAQRAAGVVKQLLRFARGREHVKGAVDARHLVHEMARIARETFPRSIRVEGACSPDVWPVVADPTQLHQVLLNLCVNARDAMPAGGVLTISAENVVLDERYVATERAARPGPHVRVRVTDTGSGIPESVQPRIFESFFTTKGEGQGTGLGLATAQGIVHDHGGMIAFTTVAGGGTTFEIHLPAAPETAANLEQAPDLGTILEGQGELIMVVDDEPAICDTTRRSLERHGYRMLQAQDGIEALVQFSAHQPDVRAVVTDWMMPQMDGVTLCRALKALSPGIPVIVSSGGLFGTAGMEASRVFEQMGVRHILHKPHNADILLLTLAQVLGDARRSALEDTGA